LLYRITINERWGSICSRKKKSLDSTKKKKKKKKKKPEDYCRTVTDRRSYLYY
jgi:hypothetical protein